MAQLPHSILSLTEMEGLNNIGDVTVPDNMPQGNPLTNQFLYLRVRTELGQPLAPTLFEKRCDRLYDQYAKSGNVTTT